MGLSIHYTLQSAAGTAEQARKLVEKLRKRALDLPFAEVGEVVELTGDACNFETYDGNHPLRWLAVQARQYRERHGTYYPVKPNHAVAFTTYPGEGCEIANLGLATYPDTIEVRDATGCSRRLSTGLTGWCWTSFCKTQYASRHGMEHFLRCHLCVIRMLDHAKELGVLANVKDEGGFWDGRDAKALVLKVGEWNEGMARLVGELEKTFGGTFIAPITEHPEFKARQRKPRSS